MGSDDSDSDSSTAAGQFMSVSDPSYSSRVEFALKLGYTELQVQKALSKLGQNPAQNELLAELIQLASMAASNGSKLAGLASGQASEFEPSVDGLRLHRPLSSSTSEELRHIVIDGSNVAIR